MYKMTITTEPLAGIHDGMIGIRWAETLDEVLHMIRYDINPWLRGDGCIIVEGDGDEAYVEHNLALVPIDAKLKEELLSLHTAARRRAGFGQG